MGNNGDWPEPEPLRRPPESGNPFPMDALGVILGPAAIAMHEIIKAPPAVCAQSVLAVANLAVQGYADVAIDGRHFPISEFFLTIALSGDRKSAADRAALASVEAHQQALMEFMKSENIKFEKETQLWKRERDYALKKRSAATRREALSALPPAPTTPLYPQLTTEEPTYEGIVKLLATSWPAVGLFSDEGGRFLGGHAMNQEHRLKTLAGLSALWDGRPITRTRAGDGASTLYGRRVCVHFLMQPMVAENILADELAHDQGFLSRCLVAAPETTLGNQKYRSEDLAKRHEYGRYCIRLTELLNTKLPFKIDPGNGKPLVELIPRKLSVATEGLAVWIPFHDWVQDHLGPEGLFRPISGIAAKAAEHALRLAGTMALVDNIDTALISPEHVKAGIILAKFYLTEALRLFHAAKMNPDLLLAEKVLTWLLTRECPDNHLVSLPDVYQMGPNSVRDKATAAKIMQILTEHFWVKPLEGGAKIGGVKRRQAWEVRPDV